MTLYARTIILFISLKFRFHHWINSYISKSIGLCRQTILNLPKFKRGLVENFHLRQTKLEWIGLFLLNPAQLDITDRSKKNFYMFSIAVFISIKRRLNITAKDVTLIKELHGENVKLNVIARVLKKSLNLIRAILMLVHRLSTSENQNDTSSK